MNLRAGLLFVLIFAVAGVHADDGAASVAAGGVVVMKREPRITMAKEVLKISGDSVVVDYDFRNDSDEDVTTEVAFPIPDYDDDHGDNERGAEFNDFKLWIDGVPRKYEVEARAFLKGQEYTQLLTSMGVDIGSFGHYSERSNASRDIKRLTPAQRKQLEKAGLVIDDVAHWAVKKKYHWQQTFPARKIVHIRHEYTPYVGSTNSITYGMSAGPDPQMAEEIRSMCVEGSLKETLRQIADSKDRDAPYFYVDFILTTANTWKTPIEDFTLIVERSHDKDYLTKRDLGNYVSFCWDGPVTKLDADHFSAHLTNFVPNKELRVGFFTVEHRRWHE